MTREEAIEYEEFWNNSLNKYLAIMDTRTDYIPVLVDEIVKGASKESEEN